ncbi:ATP-binding protein [Paucibacter sp. APW11]|uniref:histidine kinase n=1 Tax=Roseateles aquae TaxID=3077235 RepID=A0ABU3P9S8_9BURK|nr:ATP-binding protein [Paucibacter sp. APW11]MDT8999321.1 ATP-binding protein [Paucibacter sp. APW11]
MNKAEGLAPEIEAGALPPGSSTDLQALIDQLPHGVLLMDSHSGRLLLLNREAERLLVQRRAQLIGRNAADALEPGLAALCTSARWRALEHGRRSAREDLRLPSPFGPRWLHVQRSLLPWSGLRRPLGLLSLQDANGRRQLERALQESDTRFREVTESVRECLFVTTPQWDRLHFSSPLLLDTLGLSPMDLRHGPQLFEERIVAEDRPLYARRLQMQAQGQGSDMVLRIQHPSKGQRWVRLRTRLQPHKLGSSLVYGILADVTEEQEGQRELQRARDEAEAASRAKSEFMATMSHEIRTPMNGVLGMTQLLLDSSLNEQQLHWAQSAYGCAEAMLHLIDDVLDFADAGAAQSPRPAQCFEPVRLAEECLQALYSRAAAKGLRLHLQLSPSLPAQLCADATGLRRALAKLLDNAIKFTERGEVSLALSCDEADHLVCTVRDTGIGIAAAELPRLFSAFTQANGSLSRRYGGAGLGLAIAQQLVRLMGGTLQARSVPQQGSEFTLRVPLARLDAPTPSQRQPGEKPPNLVRRVLVVEDNQVNQEVIQQMLMQQGCQVRVAADGPAGLQALCEEGFDLVMMDIHMPGMDGMEVLRRFRQRQQQGYRFVCPPQTPVVAVTANALEGDEHKLRQHGFDDYLAKPIRQRQLLEMLQRHTPSPATPPADVSVAVADPLLDGDAMPSQSSPTPASCLDEQALNRLRELDPGGQNQLLQRVIGAFIKSLDKLLPDLAQARAAGMDLGGIRHVAHTLKSSSASLGAMQLSQLCAEIETLARKGQTEGLDKLLDAMHDEVEHVQQALNALLTGPQ